MSETLRDLVVSLSLQTDNFTRNMQSVNKQIKEAESSFKLASAGVDRFDQDAVALGSQLGALQNKLSLQRTAVEQYTRALQAARDKLQECYSRQGDYAQRLKDARQKHAQLGEQVQRATAKYEEYKNTLGESDSATIAAKQNLDALKEEYKQSEDEVKKLSGQNEALRKATQNAADAVTTASTKLNTARAAVQETESAIDKCNQSLSLSQTNWYSAGEAIQRANTEITSIGKQMQLAESKFRLATAGLKDVDNSAEGLTAKLTMLQEKLVLQEAAVQKYEDALQGAKDQLEAAQQANDPEKIRQATDAVTDAEAALNRARAAVRETRAQIDQTNASLRTARSAWTAAGNSLTSFSSKCNKAGKAMTKAGRVLTVSLTTPIVALGKTAIEASLDFESSFALVRKTTEATEEEFEQLAAASKQMSTEVAASTEQINSVMATGGQLGIAKEHLAEFTRVMIDLQNASTDLDADTAATQLAKFVNIMGTGQDKFSNIGSTIAMLGNNFATTEAPIAEMSMRIAGAGKQIGLTEPQVLGLATALSSVGIQAQMGGSSISKALIKMEVAASTGGKELKDFAKITGMTEREFVEAWRNDPIQVFQKFIEGLAEMSDEGISSIAVLDEIGISEIRLRDTVLRAVNATELFSNAQKMAQEAWDKNTALAEKAGVRYNTTASKLTNLKNKAMLFAQQLGDDLNPTIQNLIKGVSELIDKFMGMDEAQRMQIIKIAGIVAAIGPVLLVVGKVTRGVGAVTGVIGKFATAVGKAGGGFSGFLKVLGSSPAFWFAVAAAVMVGVHALYDYISGAKAAREAINGMKKAADDLENTGVKTFYSTGTADVLARFGLTKEQFQSGINSSKSWIESLKTVWSDGKKETDEIVSQFVEGFTSVSDQVREGIERRKSTLDQLGLLDAASETKMDADLAQLAAWDDELQKLLKKRQNKLLTEKDQARLDEIIQLRAQLQLEYIGPESGAYEEILKGIENEKSRALAASKSVGLDLFGDALTAAAQGQKAYLDALNAEYDSRRQNLLLISDEEQRVKALADLDTWYAERRQANADSYEDTVSKIGKEAFADDGIQSAISSIGDLYALMQNFDGSLESLQAVQAWMDNMDGDGLASVLTLMSQLRDAGIDESVLGFDPSGILAQWQSISNLASAFPQQLEGLNKVINEVVPSEVQEVLVSLNLTTASEEWAAFMEGKNPFSVTADMDAVPEYVDINGKVTLKPLDQARIRLWKSLPGNQIQLDGQVNTTVDLAFGDDWKKDLDLLWKANKLKAYGTNGLPIDVTPEVIASLTADDIVLGMDEDGTYHLIVKPTWESATTEDVAEAMEELKDDAKADNGLFGSAFLGMNVLDSLDWLNHWYDQYDREPFHGLFPENNYALKMAESTLTPKMAQDMADSIALMVGAVNNGQALTDESLSFLYKTADALEYINKYGKNAELPSSILQNLAAMGIDLKSADLPNYLRTILVTSYDLAHATEQVDQGTASLQNAGQAANASLEGLDEATRRAILAQEAVESACDSTSRYISLAKKAASESEVYANTSMAKINLAFAEAVKAGVPIEKASELLNNATSYHDAIEKLYGAIDEVQGSHIPVEELNSDLAFMTAYCDAYYMAMQRMKAGDSTITQEKLNALDQMFTQGDIEGITAAFKDMGITLGGDTGAGIGSGLADYDFSSDAASSASSLEDALRTAYDSHSPANLTKPVGHDAAAGIGEGMKEYDFSSSAAATADHAKGALQNTLNAALLRPIGYSAMLGLISGIQAGRSGVISAMRSVARAAVNAAKSELKIASPSKVFRDEVGSMTMKGFGEGILEETRAQAQIVKNAARYLTGEAQEGAIGYTSTDNRRTYNNTSSVNLTGNNFYIRDEQDIRSLAIEIASLTRRQQRGKGLRMA